MKKIVLYVLLVMACFSSTAQTISNFRLEQVGQVLEIRYDLAYSSVCEVQLWVSPDNGKNWNGPLTKVKGDVGKNISAGSKVLQWSVLEEREQLVGEQIRFKLVAIKEANKVASAPSPNRSREKPIYEYCSGADYKSTQEAFRSSAVGESFDRDTAKKKALSNAMTEMYKTITATIKIVGETYVKSNEVSNKIGVKEVLNEMASLIVDQELRGCIEICEKLTQKPDGVYRSYAAIELKAEVILNAIHDGFSKNDRIKADYNYKVFERVFENEMKKLAEW
jgi:hypothetical protein